MEKMEKYLEKKKNEKNDTFEQILEKELILKNHSKVMYDPKLIPTEMIKQ